MMPAARASSRMAAEGSTGTTGAANQSAKGATKPPGPAPTSSTRSGWGSRARAMAADQGARISGGSVRAAR